MAMFMSSYKILAATTELKVKSGVCVLNGGDPCTWGSRRIEGKAPPDPHRAVFSGGDVVLY